MEKMLYCQGAANGDGGMVFKQIKWKMLHCQGAGNGDGGMVPRRTCRQWQRR
jgi:hypothetical protein